LQLWAEASEGEMKEGAVGASVGSALLFVCATVLLLQGLQSGRTVLFENYNEPDYFDRQARQARADGIR